MAGWQGGRQGGNELVSMATEFLRRHMSSAHSTPCPAPCVLPLNPHAQQRNIRERIQGHPGHLTGSQRADGGGREGGREAAGRPLAAMSSTSQ